MRWLWIRRTARAGIGIVVVGAVVAIVWWLWPRDPEERVPIATDAAIERALAREAARALRERPRGNSGALSLRPLAEHWKAPDAPRPAARHRPQALEATAKPSRVPRDAPGALVSPEIQRGRPPELGDARARFRSSVQALAAPPTP